MSALAMATVVAGSLVFLVGASLGVPTVFTTPDPGERERLLTEHSVRWRRAQAPYAAGPVIAAIGVTLAGGLGGAAVAGGVAMLIGALAWSYSCFLRGGDPVAFVRGEQPAWPFRTYVWLTILGLAGLGWALLQSDAPAWLGWVVVGADAGFLTLYATSGDIPPFVFYLLLMAVGLAA